MITPCNWIERPAIVLRMARPSRSIRPFLDLTPNLTPNLTLNLTLNLLLGALLCLLTSGLRANAQTPEVTEPAVAPTKAPKFSKPPTDLRPAAAAAPSPAAQTNAALSAVAALATSPGDQPGATNGLMALDDKYRLAIGDRLSFRIVEDEEEPKSLFVTDSGELEVPYLGRYPAVGKSCAELAHALKVELEKEYYYQATVIVAVDVMTKSRGKVYLSGSVRAPGPQDVPSDEVFTLSKAILRAGGFTDFADRRKVKVTRKGNGREAVDQSFTVNVEEILERGKTDADLPLEPGDQIFIQDRLFRF